MVDLATETSPVSSPTSIWTWRGKRSTRAALYLPYLSTIEKRNGSTWQLSFNGGSIEADLNKVDFVLVYGISGSLSVEFLDALCQRGIPLIVHRTHKARAYCFEPGTGHDRHDVLTRQILARRDARRATYIARTLVRARLLSMRWLIPLPKTELAKLSSTRSVARVRSLEAIATRRYWRSYLRRVGTTGPRRGDEPRPLKQALDACSMYVSGIVLRWTLFHKLSPQHGYLHEPSSYASLVYDLMEPYRTWMERAVMSAAQDCGIEDSKSLVSTSIAKLKDLFEEAVYVPCVRETVRRKNLLHGAVLSLRSYLRSEMSRFVLPVEGERIGGRPPKVSYRIPGQIPDR